MTSATTAVSPGRDRRRAVPQPDKALRLTRTFGCLLRQHRGDAHMTQTELATAAGLSRSCIDLLERGWRRPSTVCTWRLARALRPRGTLRDPVALDDELRRAAGPSLCGAATKPHLRREAARAEPLAEAGDGVLKPDARLASPRLASPRLASPRLAVSGRGLARPTLSGS